MYVLISKSVSKGLIPSCGNWFLSKSFKRDAISGTCCMNTFSALALPSLLNFFVKPLIRSLSWGAFCLLKEEPNSFLNWKYNEICGGSQTSLNETSSSLTLVAFDPCRRTYTVSYTHLDVYKRQ